MECMSESETANFVLNGMLTFISKFTFSHAGL